nr:hypothetical protein L203_05982 [Cryptococcus depauperatus CBS 7841]
MPSHFVPTTPSSGYSPDSPSQTNSDQPRVILMPVSESSLGGDGDALSSVLTIDPYIATSPYDTAGSSVPSSTTATLCLIVLISDDTTGNNSPISPSITTDSASTPNKRLDPD